MISYGKKSPTTGTPSVYSHVTSRSTANLRSSRSIKSLKIPWYRRPLITDSIILDVQRAAVLMAVFSLVCTNLHWNPFIDCFFFQLLSIFTVITACFDLYCYAMAVPGSVHTGYYAISYQFIFVGSRHGECLFYCVG